MDYTNLSDEDLVARCREQLPYNTEAFAAIVARFEARVFDACLRYLGDEADAEEITQNVFLKIFHSVKKFEGRSAFRTWIFRITANECATRYRKRKRRVEGREAYARSLIVDRPGAELDIPINRQPDLGGPLGLAWATLTENDRTILILRHIAELSLAETAASLDLGLSAAKMRLYRAEERLREAYRASQRNVTFSSTEAVIPPR